MHKQSDQAAGIRKMNKIKPVRVIAVTSGKGGVGKTNLSVNIGIALVANGAAGGCYWMPIWDWLMSIFC